MRSVRLSSTHTFCGVYGLMYGVHGQVTGNMTSVVRGMDKAMESMNLERVRLSTTPQLVALTFDT
jgi:hypothetical protein